MHHLNVWFRLYQNTVRKLKMKIVQVSMECILKFAIYFNMFFSQVWFIDFGDFLFKIFIPSGCFFILSNCRLQYCTFRCGIKGIYTFGFYLLCFALFNISILFTQMKVIVYTHTHSILLFEYFLISIGWKSLLHVYTSSDIENVKDDKSF